MRIYRFMSLLAILSALVFACRTPDAANSSENKAIVSYEGELGMKPGVGYESVFEDVRGNCVEFTEEQPSGQAQEVIYKLDLIENHYDLASTLNVSSGSQVKAAIPDTNVSVSQKTRFVLGNTYSINRYSIFLLVNVQVRNETTHLMGVKLREEVKNELARDPASSLNKFRVQCGDAYMAGYTTGGEYYGILEIQTDSDEMKSQIKQEIETAAAVVGVGETSQSTAIEATLTKISKNRKVKIWSYQRGGAGEEQAAPVETVEEMMKRAKNLTNSVRVGENPRRITATFLDYFTLDVSLPDQYRNDLLSAQETMKELARMQSSLMDLQGDIDYVMVHTNSFLNVTPATLISLRDSKKAILQTMRSVYDAAYACYRELKSCTIPATLKVPAVDLPERRPTIATISTDKVVIKTNLQFVDSDALYDGWLNPPECYVMITLLAKGEEVPLRRTETTVADRCKKLDYTIEIPISLIKSTAEQLGAKAEDSTLYVAMYEDDISYDDLVGYAGVSFKRLQKDSAVTTGINNAKVNMDVGFEMR